jgi:hypothetical protein
MLGEFDGESLAGGAMQSGEKSFHDPSRDNLDSPKGGDGRGVEQVSAVRRGCIDHCCERER